MRKLVFGAVIVAVAVSSSAITCQAADVSLFCGLSLEPLVRVAVSDFEQQTGDHVSIAFSSVDAVVARLKKGETADLICTSPGNISELEQKHEVAGDTAVITTASIGVATQPGAPRPDISTMEGFKAALENAPSIAVHDPAMGGPTGIAFMRMLDEMGIADEIMPKLILTPGPRTALDELASGRVDLALSPASEIKSNPRIQYVGPIPSRLQLDTVYVGAIPVTAKSPAEGRELLKFLILDSAPAKLDDLGLD